MVAVGVAIRSVVAVRGTGMILDDVGKHYRTLWGEPSRTASFHLSGHKVDVLKWSAEKTAEQVNIYATVGASAHVVSGYDNEHRLEFFVGLKPAQDDVARPLAMLALEAVVNRTELGHGHSVTFPEPLWRGTPMSGFLVLRPASNVVPPLGLAGGLHVDFLQAIPVFQSEVEFKTGHKAEGLLQRWEAAGVPFWNPNRAPEPGLAEVSG